MTKKQKAFVKKDQIEMPGCAAAGREREEYPGRS